jgi:hypothetical protein
LPLSSVEGVLIYYLPDHGVTYETFELIDMDSHKSSRVLISGPSAVVLR